MCKGTRTHESSPNPSKPSTALDRCLGDDGKKIRVNQLNFIWLIKHQFGSNMVGDVYEQNLAYFSFLLTHVMEQRASIEMPAWYIKCVETHSRVNPFRA